MKNKIILLIIITMMIIIPFDVSAMQIKIKDISSNELLLEVESSDTIEALKQKIYDKNNVLPEKQKLFFSGIELIDGRTLADYNIKSNNTIDLDYIIKVIFDANGGLFESSTTYTINDWNPSLYDTLSIPSRDGYKFIGYYTEKTGGTKFEMILNESGIDKDSTYYAQWEPNEISEGEESSKIPEPVPDTGDNIIFSVSIFLVSLIVLILVAIIYRKRKSN